MLVYTSGVGCLSLILVDGQRRPWARGKRTAACAFLWTYPEIRTCSIESWWHSSLRGKQRHTTRNGRCNGLLASAKPTKSLSAAFTPHSKKRFWATCSNGITPWFLHSDEHFIRRSRYICKQLLSLVENLIIRKDNEKFSNRALNIQLITLR